ncbi:homocysteine S-methyltransferase [Clostridium acetobutylicum]|uniref:S-methylmethionine:homocysteine methyltransferase n=1 Tax=Clostridium acetobutylicum (strain ATCC 824 / DSM 792 / JCM 1419 / IAM 19013 / LMG 5710 / NBRC 13948 / NRRL B-527 / VKM B-1787 / 2291 / W) TaxID=272562 RepID=Q97DX2_CLOAB|nr:MULTISPECIES: homocysteine S-methyltransferase [Clostridium]AAK81280.1 Possible homocysteine S-methyltransferase [Clostridium acetobutylicum ATCC 824]ADZ22388.1 homocysteine methyltransferase [Clostridium acetobutylicum EA 2018]AEI34044.1 homocysteine methyltransferase [Clostridium acetobutylicum DSM 1731]AWV81053.1 homocysteine S-methyltransferase [Clostridium acetobutylicum]MBC2395567.1 homocysteine S-methyltransferase [Clostridium acetobutylicum]
MSNPIKSILDDFPVVILDGALATELEKRGCNLNDSLWSAKILANNPEIIENVHYDYFVSGSDCAITSSYQATIDGFMKNGFPRDKAKDLIRNSVAIAKKARDRFWGNPTNRRNRAKPFIAGSVGPYGAYLADGSEYRGDYKIDENALIKFHKSNVKLLIEAGADILACETIPNLTEARAIVKLLEEFPGVYAWISFSCKNDYEISDGTPIFECAKVLNSCKNIAAIGVNCTSPKYINSLIKEIKKASDKPIIVYPNSGEEYDANTKTWHGASSSNAFSISAKEWFENGASVIGGCCRTTPSDINATYKILKNID